jgi:integrase
MDVLAEALQEQHGILIQSAQGTMCSDEAFRRGWDSYMVALSRAAGKKVNIRPHDLRHSYCTMLRDAGVDMKLAMQWMGHADEKMILRIYDHVSESRVSAAMESLEKLQSAKTGVKTGVKV